MTTRASIVRSVNAITRHLLVGVIAMSAFAAHAASSQSVTLSMQPQKDYFAERCFTLESGQQLAFQFTTRSPIEFNVHHHPEHGETVFPDRLVVKAQHSKQIIAQSTGEYCFMTKNLQDQPAGFDVVISYEITTP